MSYIDAFNGDADGICALLQIRKSHPVKSKLITGVKRDITLLRLIEDAEANNAFITVLDISYEKNKSDVDRLIRNGANINYIDHHQAGKINKHKNLKININLSAHVCTSLLTNKFLEGEHVGWAITGAFGDNLIKEANELAKLTAYNDQEVALINSLGILLNYNAYGDSISDLIFPPAEIYNKLLNYKDPIEFIKDSSSEFKLLQDTYNSDLSNANQAKIVADSKYSSVYILPNQKWSRRVSGVFGNTLANRNPNKAHAVFREQKRGGFLVSIRAPINKKVGADIIAGQFPSGGGRKAAAGINHLPESLAGDFCRTFDGYYKDLFK